MELGLILKSAAVLFDNPGGNRKAEASSGFFGCEEWIEKTLFDFGRNSCASVADIENDHIPETVTQPRGVAARAQSHGTIAADALGGILNEVDQDLLDLLGI